MIKIPVVRPMVFNRLHLKFINAYDAYIIDIVNPHHGIMRMEDSSMERSVDVLSGI